MTKMYKLFLEIIKNPEKIILILAISFFIGFSSGSLHYGMNYLDCMDGKSSSQTIMGFDAGGNFHTDMKVESYRADYCHNIKGYNVGYMIKKIIIYFLITMILLLILESILTYFNLTQKFLYYIAFSIMFFIIIFIFIKISQNKEEPIKELKVNYDIADFQRGIWRTDKFKGNYFVSLSIFDEGKCNYFYYTNANKTSDSYVVSGQDNCSYIKKENHIEIDSFDNFTCTIENDKNYIKCDETIFKNSKSEQ